MSSDAPQRDDVDAASKAVGYPEVVTHLAGLIMWIALLVLWLGGLYIANDVKSSRTCSDLPGTVWNATALNENPHAWWIASSNVIVILTFCASMLCCCSIITLCCSCKVVAYMSLVAIAISVLVYFVLAAWVGLGTMMADTHTCAKYSLYLTLFYAYFLVLLAFCITSALWKTNSLTGKKMTRRKHNGRMD
ncbi:hypothetical protein EMCRGX_G020309 [Ephydatia muelleri]|eukprot:Em0016g232a